MKVVEDPEEILFALVPLHGKILVAEILTQHLRFVQAHSVLPIAERSFFDRTCRTVIRRPDSRQAIIDN